MAGAVVIGPIYTHGSSRDAVLAVSHPGRHTLFAKCAVLVVAVKLVWLRIVCDEDIRPSVVVEINDSDAERLAVGIGQPGLVRHILEAAAAQVVKQLARSSFVRLGRAVRLDAAVQRAPQVAFFGPLN